MSLYDGAKTRVRVGPAYSEEFEVKVGVHQGFILALYQLEEVDMKLKPTNLSTCPIKQCKTSLVQVLVLLHVHCLFEGQHNEWVSFICDGTGPADKSERTKRVQGWSHQNWLHGYTHCCFLVYSTLINC